jgi:Flp pilus assembly protein TadD
MRGMPLRIALALVALVVAAWLALGLRNASLEEEGRDLARSPAALRDPAVARQADDRLRAAETLNPDNTPLTYRGQLALRLKRYDEAIRIFRELTRREPESVTAWGLLANAAGNAGDRELLDRALGRARALAAPVR